MPSLSSRLDSITDTNTTDNWTTGSFSPTASALLLVMGTTIGNTTNPTISSVTDTFTGTGSWTIVQAESTLSNNVTGFIAYAMLGGSPGSGTVTVNAAENSVRTVVDVYEATSYNTSTPVTQSNTNTGNGDTLTVTFSGAPASDSLVVGSACSRCTSDPDVTPGADFTEAGELYSGGSSVQTHVQTEYDAANADTTTDWSDLPTQNNVGVAIEIAAAAAGGGTAGPLVNNQPLKSLLGGALVQ